MIEQDLINKIKTYLNSVNNLFYWKEHGGQFGTAGIPDIIICYKGRFVALECKQCGKKPTILQSITLRRIMTAGGIATIITDINQVKQIIESLDSHL